MSEFLPIEKSYEKPWSDILAFSRHLLLHRDIVAIHGAFRKMDFLGSFEEISLFILNEKFSRFIELRMNSTRMEFYDDAITKMNIHAKKSIACEEILIANMEEEILTSSKYSIFVPINSDSMCFAISGVGDPALSDDLRMALKAIASIIAVWVRPLLGDYIKKDSISIQENLSKLSKRQLEIFTHMKAGKTNLEIALLIGFSESLVKAETVQIFQKLGISGRRDPVLLNYLAESQ